MATSSFALLSKNKFYECFSLHETFGAQITGIDLMKQDLNDKEFSNQLKEDLTRYRILIFRNQQPSEHSIISGQCQVKISKGLGTVHSTFYKHPKSPHPDIFRVSNDDNEGCTNVGRSGWHIDGTFLLIPFAYQTMYFPSVIDGGDTYFVPLKELYERQDSATQQRWNKLWMVTKGQVLHPLVYKHPRRNDTTMLFHCGGPFVSNWLVDNGAKDDISNLNNLQKRDILKGSLIQDEISRAIDEADDDLVLKIKWQAGDFAINDNTALAHYACAGTQNNRRQVGLRVLHRTTILDESNAVPCKADGRTSVRIM